jgi:hypothetical protein
VFNVPPDSQLLCVLFVFCSSNSTLLLMPLPVDLQVTLAVLLTVC